MQKDLSIAEFETLVTTGALFRLVDFESKTIIENPELPLALRKTALSVKEVLEVFGFGDKLVPRIGYNKIQLIYKLTGRIACELKLDGIYRNNHIRQLNAVLLSRRGFCKARTVKGLIDYTASLPMWRARGGMNGKHHQG